MPQDLTVVERQELLDHYIEERRVALPDPTWVRILDTLAVPNAQREADACHISSILTTASLLFFSGISPRDIATVHERHRQTSAAATALVNDLLSYGIGEAAIFEFNAVCFEAGRNPEAAPDLVARLFSDAASLRLRHFEQALRGVAAIAATTWATGLAQPRIISCPRERAFPVCVALLYQAAAARGWNLTLSHSTESGTLIDLIDTIEPHMPAGFVPRPLSMKLLRGVRTKALETP